LALKFSEEWYPEPKASVQNPSEACQQRCQLALSNSFLETSQQKKEEITPEEALQIVFKEYGKEGFLAEWKKYLSGMRGPEIKAIGRKPRSVDMARWREKGKIKASPQNKKTT
jgi:hypothetical protein